MDGIINLYKPTGITSAKALYRVRKITGVRKSGHAGSLDPAAAGVLILCQGKATKLVEQIMDLPKVYRATGRLDVTSESYDSDRPLKEVVVDSSPSEDQVRAAFAELEGEVDQVPPRISAIKVGGVPSYKLSTRDGVAPLKSRKVRIYWMHVHRYAWPVVDFEMCCGRGTYVRSVIRDVGLRLGTGGCLTGLVRKAVGPFTFDEAWTFERLESAGAGSTCVIPLAQSADMVARRPVTIPDRPTLPVVVKS